MADHYSITLYVVCKAESEDEADAIGKTASTLADNDPAIVSVSRERPHMMDMMDDHEIAEHYR